MTRLLWGCALLVPLAGVASGPGEALHYRRVEQHLQVPDAILTNPYGKSFSLAQELAADGPVVLNFFSTVDCADGCAGMHTLFAKLQSHRERGRSGLRLISIAVNPRQDTPARLRHYAKALGAGSDWMLLTGLGREIEPVMKAFGAGAIPGSTTFVHPGPKAAWVRLDGRVSPADILTELR